MANDRVLMRCKKCGKRAALFKYYPSSNGWGSYVPDKAPDWLTDFIQEHLVDCQEWFGMDLAGDPRFDLVTEDG